MPEPDDKLPEFDDSFAPLDAYLNDLHRGSRSLREEILAKHPELEPVLDCLDAIDILAPGEAAAPPPNVQELPTMDGSGSAVIPQSLVSPPSGQFGDYELIAEIGRGGMGVVYRARQKSLDRVVAIKMILASHLASREQVERFYAEAKAAARLRHPNIVGIHEVGQLHGQHFFAMEHIEGSSLAQQLEGGPMDAERAAVCLVRMARATHHLHEQGIVHRDLKPSNVLMDQAGEPHITDFGLAKLLEGPSHMTHTGAIVGTPSYMAPEQAAGRTDQVGPLSDVYSLGAMLYDMLTGRPPFREASPLDTLVQVLEAEPRVPSQLNPRVPRDLELICMKCLEKNPETRYPSAAAVADDLERFLQGESVEARTPGPWLRLRRWSRREPALSSRLIVLALCAGILQLSYWLKLDSADPVDSVVHAKVIQVLGVWGLASLVFQRLLSRQRWSEVVRYAWAATDAAMLTLLLWISDLVQSPVVIGFPALVATSGLWFRERLVWFMTAICTLSYVGLLADAMHRGVEIKEPMFRHIILLVVLVGLGFVVGYQVKRMRALSQYYEHRWIP